MSSGFLINAKDISGKYAKFLGDITVSSDHVKTNIGDNLEFNNNKI